MKVAIDTTPLKSGHSVRGIGSYTQKLIASIKNIPQIELETFDGRNIPNADIVHYPYFDLFFRTLPVGKSQKRIVTIHDVIPLVFPNRFPAGIRGYVNLFFQKRALKNTDHVICDSEASKKDIIDKLSFPKGKISVIYLAASANFKKIEDQKKLLETSKKFKLPKKFALFVGDVNWNKNIGGLLNSIAITQIPLVMVGAAIVDGQITETRALNKLIRKLKLENKVTKTGFVTEEELVSLYNLAAVTLLPSFYEGFGLPVIESMACGTPIVCADNSSLSEIAGSLAIFCDPQDPNDISKKTQKVLHLSKNARANLSAKLIKRASTFTWEKTAEETVRVYKKVIG